MKKFLLVLGILLLTSNVFAADEWLKTQPAGSNSISDIDALVGENNTALDRLLANYNTIALSYSSAAQLTASIGEVTCSNSDGSVRKMRQNTAATTITWADIDTGAEAGSTTYYVYANCDADATTATFKISASSTAPTGLTYYKRLGYFYNDASSNITYLITNDNNFRGKMLGDWTSKSDGTAYQATTDGFVVVRCTITISGGLIIYSDTSSSPSTERCSASTTSSTTYVPLTLTCPVKKGDYWKTVSSGSTSGVNVAWIPLQ